MAPASNAIVGSSSRPVAYQAEWPTALLVRFIEAAGNSDSKALSIMANFGKQGYVSRTLTNAIIRPVTVLPFAEMIRANLLGRAPNSEQIYVKTPDRNTLHGILIPGWHSPQKAIIFCNPNETPMEIMGPTYLRLAYEAGCTGVIFNPRGVDLSEGETSPEGLILDAYTMFEYLVNERHMSPNDIVIYGRSMGGGWGSEAAALIQEQYPHARINFISERSFRNLIDEAASIVSRDVPCLSQTVYGIAFCLLNPSKLIFNAKTAVESLRGRILIIYHKHDGIIPYKGGSLNRVLEDHNCQSQEITRIELRDEDLTQSSYHYHLRDFTEAEYKQLNRAIKSMLNIEFNYEQSAS